MVDSIDIYKSLNINIRTVMRNPEILKFIPNHLKIKIMCKHAVKKLSYLVRNLSGQYNTQQMVEKAILEYSGTLNSIPDCYKNHEICNKAVDIYPYTLEFIPKCYKTKEMIDKAVNRFDSICDWYKTLEMCDRVVSEDPSLIACSNKYNSENVSWSCW